MKKTILITGSTDGIGYETAKTFVEQGHHVLLHGRSQAKLDSTSTEFSSLAKNSGGKVEIYRADLSDFQQVKNMATAILQAHKKIDVLINNAGILKTNLPVTSSGLDARFAVNTLAPYLLTRLLLPIMDNQSRVVNLSSAAQAPVNFEALSGRIKLQDHMTAYSQSKLAITMWTQELGKELSTTGPVIVAVNPGSLLASKMVKQGFGIAGNDIRIGADILIQASMSDEFSDASGKYYDNDIHRFSMAHPESQDTEKCASLMVLMNKLLENFL